MTSTPTIVEIDLDTLEPALDAMDRYTAAHRGWINIQPQVEEQNVPPAPSIVAQLFRAGGPMIALATWTPPDGKRPDSPQIIGMQHRLGTAVIPLLDDLGVARPDWRRMQDSPRRGLVVAAPAATPHDEILRWLMSLTLAATRVESTGSWVASLNAGRSSTT